MGNGYKESKPKANVKIKVLHNFASAFIDCKSKRAPTPTLVATATAATPTPLTITRCWLPDLTETRLWFRAEQIFGMPSCAATKRSKENKENMPMHYAYAAYAPANSNKGNYRVWKINWNMQTKLCALLTTPWCTVGIGGHSTLGELKAKLNWLEYRRY